MFIQLKRPSDGVTSNPLPFKYVPLNRIRFLDLRSKLEKQPNSDIFQEIHSSDIENYISNDKVELNDLNTSSGKELYTHIYIYIYINCIIIY